ncbi:hypothetical protein LMH73_002645 [Vibrio splendidus]|nr:hypothetical protein [Vibrio splendidus]MCC4880470.1 hypothetical protein [Vibrio splendidus]
MTKIAIAFDFCGVLDIKDSYTINDPSLNFRVAKMADWQKCLRLFKLIDKYDLHFFCSSDYQKNIDVFQSIMLAVMDSQDEEAMAFVKGFRKGKGRKHKIRCRTDWPIKNALLYHTVKDASIDTVITLEDDECIDAEYNPIYINGSNRMTDENFRKLEDKIIMTILECDKLYACDKWDHQRANHELWGNLDHKSRANLHGIEIYMVKSRIEKCEADNTCVPRVITALKRLQELHEAQLSLEQTKQVNHEE